MEDLALAAMVFLGISLMGAIAASFYFESETVKRLAKQAQDLEEEEQQRLKVKLQEKALQAVALEQKIKQEPTFGEKKRLAEQLKDVQGELIELADILGQPISLPPSPTKIGPSQPTAVIRLFDDCDQPTS